MYVTSINLTRSCGYMPRCSQTFLQKTEACNHSNDRLSINIVHRIIACLSGVFLFIFTMLWRHNLVQYIVVSVTVKIR